MISTISEFTNKFLLEEKEKAKVLVDSLIDMDINQLFTNDYEYMSSWTSYATKQSNNNNAGTKDKNDSEMILGLLDQEENKISKRPSNGTRNKRAEGRLFLS